MLEVFSNGIVKWGVSIRVLFKEKSTCDNHIKTQNIDLPIKNIIYLAFIKLECIAHTEHESRYKISVK